MSKIRFFLTAFYYPEYLDIIYKKNPDLKYYSYSKQLSFLHADFYKWSDVWKVTLEETGKYECLDYILNAEFLQKKWAEENNISYNKENWIEDIFEKQIEYFKPNIIFVNDIPFITPEFRKRIKKNNTDLKLFIGWDGIAINDHQRFEGCDMILSCLESVIEYYKQHGYKGYYFQYGFDNRINSRIISNSCKYNFTFSGSLYGWKNYHLNRLQLIKQLAVKTPIQIFTSYVQNNWGLFTRMQLGKIRRFQFKEYLQDYYMGKRIKPPVFGMELFQLLHDSKITFNSHIDSAGSKAANIRLYEATGVGTCLLTDYKDNLNDIFEIDKEIVAYKNIDEAIEKVNYLLNNDNVRISIANAGMKKTITKYSIQKRIIEFEEFLSLHI